MIKKNGLLPARPKYIRKLKRRMLLRNTLESIVFLSLMYFILIGDLIVTRGIIVIFILQICVNKENRSTYEVLSKTRVITNEN